MFQSYGQWVLKELRREGAVMRKQKQSATTQTLQPKLAMSTAQNATERSLIE